MDKNLKILIAPWGDPAGWQETTYALDDKKLKSKSSLKLLKQITNPDYSIILASDTLALEGQNYNEVKRSALEKVEKFLKENNIEDINVLILPGVGKFQDRITKKEVFFKGNPTNYYYSLLFQLSNFFIKNLNLKEYNAIKVYLDITHGVNYMTVMTYRALQEILSILSMFLKVRLTVYNTDPAMPFSLSNEVKINKIENSKIFPIPIRNKAKKKDLVSFNEKYKEDIFSLRNSEINLEEINAFIGSIFNGLPLAVYTFFPNIDLLKNMVEKSYELLEKATSVKNDVLLEVERELDLNEDFKIFTMVLLVSFLMKKKELIKERKKEISFEELKFLKDNLFKFDNRLKNFLDNEIGYNLEKKISPFRENSKLSSEWKQLSDLLGQKQETINARNFLAHGGFEYNAVLVKEENEKILFKYKDEFLKTIKDFCQKGLIEWWSNANST